MMSKFLSGRIFVMHVGFRLTLILMLLTVALAAPLLAQNAEQMPYAPLASSKFMTLPMLPACMTLSAQRGDPTKGPAVLLLKFTSGCVVPWHWHTSNENLMMVSGKARGEMKPGGAHMLTAGDYLYLAGKQVHQFTCISSCLVFDVIDGAFDIHYVNSQGKEIAPEEALKPMAKTPASTKP
jgi:quercetin dioxygenase-like cupin family protein